MKIVVNTIYSSSVVFFVNEKVEDCMKLLQKKNRTPDIVATFKKHEETPDNGLTTWEGDDLRLQFCYLGQIDLDSPLTYNRISHEIYHIVNNIAKLVGLKNDGEGNEHIAYLTGDITEQFFGQLFGYKRRKIDF